uniref:Uncharacterized protein n=1 Tax=Setaria viridis TaxID=4556 RepID=A0A4U6V8S8_SETVI|nr:hypothetical protein SEVIR_3G135600v2 [Setaria viridis]
MLGSKDEPILPLGIAARFRNICGAIVRDKLQTWIMTSNWKNVPSTMKEVLWATLKEKFTFPEGHEDSEKKIVESFLGRCFRNWRSMLNIEYVKKGKNTRDDFSRIPPEMWEEFVQQKNTSEARALSEENTRKAMKAAENPYHLGAGRYVAKIAKWRREEEEQRLASLSDLFEGLDQRSRNWLLARAPVFTPNGKVTFKHPTTKKIYERLEQLAEMQKKGLFKPDRERDQLTATIETAEHSAFQNNQESYRKRDHYKKDLEEKIRAISKQELIEFFATQQAQVMTNPTESDPQRQVEPPLQLANTGYVAPSSTSSIANVRYPVDEIQVVTMLVESCELDIPTDEGIEVLGDAMN